MPIEFTCSRCGATLTAPKEAAGKLAKCPPCDASVPIPADKRRTFGYLPPVVPSRLQFGDVMARSWDIYLGNLWMLILVVLLAGMGATVAMTVGMTLDAVVVWGLIHVVPLEVAVLVGIVLFVPVILPAVWIHVGQVIYVLRLARGQKAEMTDLLRGGPVVVHYFHAAVILAFLTLLGTLAFIVPGILVAVVLTPLLFLVVERDARPGEAMRASRKLTWGNYTTLAVLLAVHTAIVLLAQTVPMAIGQLFANPFLAVMWTVAYLRLTGQPTATFKVRAA